MGLRNDDNPWTLTFSNRFSTESPAFEYARPQMTWNERGTVIHISRPRGSTKGLRNKEVRTFELNKGLSPIFHIRCSPCKDAGCGREKRWQYRGTSMPLQTGCLSVVCMSHDPDSISVQWGKKPPPWHPAACVGPFELDRGTQNNRQDQLH